MSKSGSRLPDRRRREEEEREKINSLVSLMKRFYLFIVVRRRRNCPSSAVLIKVPKRLNVLVAVITHFQLIVLNWGCYLKPIFPRINGSGEVQTPRYYLIARDSAPISEGPQSEVDLQRLAGFPAIFTISSLSSSEES